MTNRVTAAARIPLTAGPFPMGSRYRALVLDLTKRDIFGRYRGASLGILWSVLSPFLMLAVYTLAFGEILKSRWPGVEGTLDFSVILFAGLIVHGFFAECLMRAPSLLVGNVNYVKRIVFPLEVLPWPMMLSALFHLGMNFVVFAVGVLIVRGGLPWTVVFLPVVVAPLAVVALGVGWFLAALGVYLRDIGQLVAPLSTALLFLSSAIIPVETLPEKYQLVFKLNPLTLIIDQVRAVALEGQLPDVAVLAMYSVGAAFWALLAYAWFQKVRGGFADVL